MLAMDEASTLDVTVVTGMSGAGRSAAADVLEDLGFFVIDNLPPALIPKVAELGRGREGTSRFALVVDTRAGDFLPELESALAELRETGARTRVLFLDASDEVLVRRFDATRRRHDSQIGHPQEQAVLDHAGHALQGKGKHFRLLNFAEGAIEDEVALIGDERRAILVKTLDNLALAAGLRGHGLDHAARRGEAEGHHLDGERKPPERLHQFAIVGDDHHLIGRGRHDLLAQQRTASALDQPQLIVDLIGAIDGEMQVRRVVERGQRNAKPLGLRTRRLGCRHAKHLESGGDFNSQRLDEARRGRAGAEPQPRPVADEIEGAQGCTFLEQRGIAQIHQDDASSG